MKNITLSKSDLSVLRGAIRLAIGREIDRMTWDAKSLSPRHKALKRLIKKANKA
jgi:hypothetical protein